MEGSKNIPRILPCEMVGRGRQGSLSWGAGRHPVLGMWEDSEFYFECVDLKATIEEFEIC